MSYWTITCLMLIPATLYASWIDHSQRRVPNWLNAAIAATGFVVQGIYFGTGGLAHGALGMLLGFGLLIGPWMIRGMGAGDVKLMAAIGVWFGPLMTFTAFCVGVVLGGLLAVFMILRARNVGCALANMHTIVQKFSSRKTLFSEFGSARSFGATSQLLPYGVPLTVGSIGVLVGQTFSWWTL